MEFIEVGIIVTGLYGDALLIKGIINGTVKQSFATWFLWLLLDAIVLYGCIQKDGETVLYGTYTFGTFFVFCVLTTKKQFLWRWFETIVSFLVIICVFILFTAGPYYGIIAGVVALTIAGIPQINDTFLDPQKTPAMAYLFFMISSLLSLLKAKGWTVEDRLPASACIIYFIIIIFLCLGGDKTVRDLLKAFKK